MLTEECKLVYIHFSSREKKKKSIYLVEGRIQKKSLFAERVTISGVSFTAIKLKIKS